MGAILRATLSAATIGAAPVHGLWVWKSAAVLEAPQGAQTLGRFCQSADITEVYVSVAYNGR
jgi:hypothetical protein